MDLAAIAETTVEMWRAIDAKLVARSQDKLEPEIKAMILDKAMSLYMTHIINEKRSGAKPPKDAPKDDEHCSKCSREFTAGELGFLEDKTGTARVCYHCSH